LGDNVYFDDVSPVITSFKSGAHLFLKEVSDPERFGVAEVESEKKLSTLNSQLSTIRVLSLEEKPSKPKSNLAATGLYLYDTHCFEMIKSLKPSERGELEITDLSKAYLSKGNLTATVLQDDWIDAGTFESLFRAAELVRERRVQN
jgi:glucose-1-phosphate thymidylyltransferase